uniref:Uncharacterized protein n=1 Tax=Triticum urartu TaxID=4572 RepID=A0A8R7K2H5_TRIUA
MNHQTRVIGAEHFCSDSFEAKTA